MGRYNLVERTAARVLDRCPGLKRSVKSGYQRVNYRLFADAAFTHEVAADVEIDELPRGSSASARSAETFFGYFDATPWNDPMTAVVFHRSTGGDGVEIVVRRDGSERPVATSAAWNHQQGSRTQWHPTREDHLLFNDVDGGEAVARELDPTGEVLTTFARPIQAVDPAGADYLSLDYRRLDRNRREYGYGLDDGSTLPRPERDGLWLVDLDTGEDELVVSLRSLMEATGASGAADAHYVNHALYDPTGSRFVFMHRWRAAEGRTSRLYVADRGGNRDALMDGTVSHYCWLDDSTLFVWGRSEAHGAGYHVLDVDAGEARYVDALDEWGDGHPSLSPDGRYVVTDTYPDRERRRHLLLYDREAASVETLGRFFEPLAYAGVDRCDLHPRWSPDGTRVSIDSAHSGTRQSYVLDVGRVVG